MADSMMEWSVRDTKEPVVPGSVMMDGWELKELLGQGGFGDVWLAEKRLLGIRDQSAIKIIRIPRDPSEIKAMRAEGFSRSHIQAEFRRNVESAVREIRTMIDLRNHPAIVPCESFDVIQYEEDESWEIDIRMQLLTPLADWVESRKVKPDDVLRMGVSLSDLLSVCEGENILHRDIKPANIFVDKLNNFKLGDFGLARIISETGSTHSKGVGTEAFMAPEVFVSGKYDHRADLYSLGLVMYWLLNGQSLPFTGESTSRSQAISTRLSGEALPVLPGVDPELDRIVRKACEADPEKRWKTAKEFHDALTGYQYRAGTVPAAKPEPVQPSRPEPPAAKPEPVQPVKPEPPAAKPEPVQPAKPEPPAAKPEPVQPAKPETKPRIEPEKQPEKPEPSVEKRKKSKLLPVLITLIVVAVLGIAVYLADNSGGSVQPGNPLVSGDQSADSSPADTAGKSLIKIGIILRDPDESGYRQANVNDMKATFTEKNGYDATFLITSWFDDQFAAARDLIAAKVKYILICPTYTDGWDDVLKEAKSAGVSVFFYDYTADAAPELYTAAVVADINREGETAVAWLESLKLDEYRILHIKGALGSTVQLGRSGALESKCNAESNWTILREGTGGDTWDPEEARKIVLAAIDAGENFNIIYAESDGLAGGAVEALEARGITHGVKGDVIVMSFDCNYWALENLLDGEWNYDGQCSPFQASAIHMLISYLEQGRSIDNLLNEKGQFFIEEYGFDARTITREDVERYGLR